MNDRIDGKNTISVCLFDSEQKDVTIVKEEEMFDDKLNEMNIYNKDHEEIYIATSPSFSPVNDKPSINDLYCQQKSRDSIDIKDDDGEYNLTQKNLSETTFSPDVSNDSRSVEYDSVKSSTSYPVVNTDDGQQSYFISSDYSQLNNLGIEVSKTFFYVLSPMESTNSLMTTTTDHPSIDGVDGTRDLMHVINDDSKSVDSDRKSLPEHRLSSGSENMIGENESNLTDFEHEPERIDIAQTEINDSEQTANVRSDFDHLNTDFNVNFIHGIPDSVDAAKDRPHVVWQQLSSTSQDEKKHDEENHPLLVKYDHSSKMEMHGQPYLQVALVNDMEPSPSELVATDQILGVPVPEIFSCKWEGCGLHFLTDSDLVKHVNVEHINAGNKQLYTCFWKGCVREGKSFDARYKMVIHLRTHTGEKPHFCPVEGCDAAFSRIENLKIHVRTHTGERPYPCLHEGCDKSFANTSDRFKHRRTHAEKKPYRCPVKGCEKCYTDPSSLRKHRKRHAPQVATKT